MLIRQFVTGQSLHTVIMSICCGKVQFGFKCVIRRQIKIGAGGLGSRWFVNSSSRHAFPPCLFFFNSSIRQFVNRVFPPCLFFFEIRQFVNSSFVIRHFSAEHIWTERVVLIRQFVIGKSINTFIMSSSFLFLIRHSSSNKYVREG